MRRKICNILQQVFRAFLEEFKLLIHDEGIILFVLFLPLAYPVIYSLIYNPEIVRDVKMVVVDHDRTPDSRELVRKLGASQYVNIIGYAADLHEGRRAMDSHDCFAILDIPEGFGRKLGRSEPANAVMYCDMSLLLRYRGFLVASVDVAQDMGSELLFKKMVYELPDVSSIASGMGDPMPINSIMLGNPQSGFDSFIMPGVIILILHQCIILAVGMAGGAKRERFGKTGSAPTFNIPSVGASMIGEALCYITIIAVPMIFLIHYVPLIFAFPMAGSVLEIFAFLLPMVIACIMLGLCIQGLVWEREEIFLLWVVTSVGLVFLTGLTWPLYATHGFLRALADILPATWGVEGFLKIEENGATIGQVGYCYERLWILAAAYAVLAYIIQRWIVRRK